MGYCSGSGRKLVVRLRLVEAPRSRSSGWRAPSSGGGTTTRYGGTTTTDGGDAATNVRVHAAVFALASDVARHDGIDASDVFRHDATDASDDVVASNAPVASDAPYASDNDAISFNGRCSDDAASFSCANP